MEITEKIYVILFLMIKKKVKKEGRFAGEKTPAKAAFLLILTEHQQGRKSC